ncbi:MAG: Tim44/TimA family putative adaptor protein [Pseudomonadota bacterium]
MATGDPWLGFATTIAQKQATFTAKRQQFSKIMPEGTVVAWCCDTRSSARRLTHCTAGKHHMDGSLDLITIISLVVAVVAILKLRSVLGRRTGDEEGRVERYRTQASQRKASTGGDNVVTLPRRDNDTVPAPAEAQAEASQTATADHIKSFAGDDKRLEEGLLAILERDPNFEPKQFLTGAKQAYEMIVTSFAEGNRRLLSELLSEDVFEGFEAAITDREERKEQIDQSFVGIEKADVLEADVADGFAQVTVKFMSQLISATRDEAGTVISGDPQKIMDVTDIWTFVRDVSSPKAAANPNWRLAATQAAN